MAKLKLIASDLDGTLLLNGAQDLNPELFPLIRQLKKQGILFMAASGREYSNLQRLFEPVRDEIAYLCLNGCSAYYQGKMLVQETMDEKDARDLILDMQKRHGELLISGKDTCYIHSENAWYIHHMRDEVHNAITQWDDLLNIPEPYSKISLYKPEYEKDLEEMKQNFEGRLTVQYGGNGWIDCAPQNVNKGTAFTKVLKAQHIAKEETIVFGDNDNDRQILKEAGIAATVCSVKEDIRRMCSLETPTVEEALKQILNQTC